MQGLGSTFYEDANWEATQWGFFVKKIQFALSEEH